MLSEYKNSSVTININHELFACQTIYDARSNNKAYDFSQDNTDALNENIELHVSRYMNSRYNFTIDTGTVYDIPIYEINNQSYIFNTHCVINGREVVDFYNTQYLLKAYFNDIILILVSMRGISSDRNYGSPDGWVVKINILIPITLDKDNFKKFLSSGISPQGLNNISMNMYYDQFEIEKDIYDDFLEEHDDRDIFGKYCILYKPKKNMSNINNLVALFAPFMSGDVMTTLDLYCQKRKCIPGSIWCHLLNRTYSLIIYECKETVYEIYKSFGLTLTEQNKIEILKENNEYYLIK